MDKISQKFILNSLRFYKNENRDSKPSRLVIELISHDFNDWPIAIYCGDNGSVNCIKGSYIDIRNIHKLDKETWHKVSRFI